MFALFCPHICRTKTFLSHFELYCLEIHPQPKWKRGYMYIWPKCNKRDCTSQWFSQGGGIGKPTGFDCYIRETIQQKCQVPWITQYPLPGVNHSLVRQCYWPLYCQNGESTSSGTGCTCNMRNYYGIHLQSLLSQNHAILPPKRIISAKPPLHINKRYIIKKP